MAKKRPDLVTHLSEWAAREAQKRWYYSRNREDACNVAVEAALRALLKEGLITIPDGLVSVQDMINGLTKGTPDGQ